MHNNKIYVYFAQDASPCTVYLHFARGAYILQEVSCKQQCLNACGGSPIVLPCSHGPVRQNYYPANFMFPKKSNAWGTSLQCYFGMLLRWLSKNAIVSHTYLFDGYWQDLNSVDYILVAVLLIRFHICCALGRRYLHLCLCLYLYFNCRLLLWWPLV